MWMMCVCVCYRLLLFASLHAMHFTMLHQVPVWLTLLTTNVPDKVDE